MIWRWCMNLAYRINRIRMRKAIRCRLGWHKWQTRELERLGGVIVRAERVCYHCPARMDWIAPGRGE